MKNSALLLTAVITLVASSCSKKEEPQVKVIPLKKRQVMGTICSNFAFCVSLGIVIPEGDDYVPKSKAPLPDSFFLDMPESRERGNDLTVDAWAVIYGLGSYFMHVSQGKPYSDTGNLNPAFTFNQISKGSPNFTPLLDNLYLLKTQGACSFGQMYFDPDDIATQPTEAQIQEAAKNRINGWAKLDCKNTAWVKMAIRDGHPVVVNSFFSGLYKDDFVSPFTWNYEKQPFGQRSSLVLSGYDDSKKAFKALNSWGNTWGDNGFCWVSYQLMQNNWNEAYVVF